MKAPMPATLPGTVAIALLLTACSMPPALFRLSEDDSLVHYHQWLSRADADVLQDARDAYPGATDAPPEERLRHALLLSFDDNASTADLEMASTLMSDVLESHPELPARHADFTRLWNSMVELRLELRETMARQAQTIDTLQTQNQELARQIEALTIIEQQLNLREQQEPGS